jgi:hypothetical protein
MATIEEAIELLSLPRDWNWIIDLARDGDGSELAEVLRDHARKAKPPLPPDVWRFLADVIDGEVKLKRRKKLTVDAKRKRHWREVQVVKRVRWGMRANGRLRDKQLRTKLTREWSEHYGTTSANVERYLHLSMSRRK